MNSIRELKGKENQTIADIVLHLSEIDCRGLFREAGYSSLFSFCTESLGYSGSAAYRRIQAARALRSNPEIYEHLVSGRLNLCTVADISRVIKAENKEELLEASIGKSKLEVQRLTSKYQDSAQARGNERVLVKKVVSSLPLFAGLTEVKEETKFSFTVEVDEECMSLIERAKCYLGPLSKAEVFKRALGEFVAKRTKAPRNRMEGPSTAVRKTKTPWRSSRTAVTGPSRYIPRLTRYRVRQRDNCHCSFKSEEGHRCSETQALQIDHIVPFARGGTNELSNLRLLCPAHNKLYAEQVFGREKINSYCHRRQ